MINKYLDLSNEQINMQQHIHQADVIIARIIIWRGAPLIQLGAIIYEFKPAHIRKVHDL